jgi:hypothetical protein
LKIGGRYRAGALTGNWTLSFRSLSLK